MSPKFKPPSPKAHHLIRVIHAQMLAEHLTLNEVSVRSGVSRTTLRKWWDGSRTAGIGNIEAVLNSMGLTTKATPLEEGQTQYIDVKRSLKQPTTPIFVQKIKLNPRGTK